MKNFKALHKNIKHYVKHIILYTLYDTVHKTKEFGTK